MKFGVIGTNFVSDFFMEGAKGDERCEVVAVCDVFEDKVNAFADKYNIEHRFTDYKELADSGLIDAIYIAVPNGLHHEIGKYFLERSIPTLLEKPLASNAREVKELVALAREKDVYFHEGLVSLFGPNYKVVKENLGLVGKIRQVNLNFSKYSSRYDAYLRGENPTTFRNDLSNGATMDLGVYCVGFAIGLFGKPQEILATAALLPGNAGGADAAGSSIYKYEDFIVNLNYSKVSDARPTAEICGELGTIIVNHPSVLGKVEFSDRKAKEVRNIGVEPLNNFYYQIKEMIDQIEKGEKESYSVPLDLSIEIHEVLTEMRKQSKIVFPADN